MAFRSILVYVDDSPQAAERVDVARSLAERFDAHLAGVAVAELVMVPEFVPTQALEAQEEAARERNEGLKALFERAVGTGGRTEWRATDTISAGGSVLDVLALHARYADLAVVGQHDPSDMRSLAPHDLPGQLALLSGTPVLALPYAWRPRPIGRRVLVGWNAGREAARAVRDALPFLAGAEMVKVAAYAGSGGLRGEGDLPAADIATQLARHGVKVEAEHNIVPDIRVAEAMLSGASDMDADLIVMGAYGRTRLREMILGGTTRNVLDHMTVPVFLSH